MIILDTREAKLNELIKSTPEFTISYSIENLLLGDIVIKHIDTSKNITYSLIIERKCVTDMIASIKDGRYKEQKIRLLAELHNTNQSNQPDQTNQSHPQVTRTRICYILEGSQTELRASHDKTLLNGSIISSIFRDGIPIIRTFSLLETLQIITRLHERFIKDINDFFPPLINQSNNVNMAGKNETRTSDELNSGEIVNHHYLESIKKCKKDNITPAMWNHMCYMNIPGISKNIAIKIAEKYPKIKDLLLAYQNITVTDNNTDNNTNDNIDTIEISKTLARENLLADIILTETDKQKRRIGGVISKRVYEYFM